MTWCNKLASTPIVGFTMNPHHVPGEFILNAVASILDANVDGTDVQFRLDKQEAFAVEFTTHAGFHYGIDLTKIFVAFRHRMRAKLVSGGPPIMEMLSQPLPFTELLPEVLQRLVTVTMLLPGIREREITRLGIVTSSNVADDELPPGIARFIEYIARPWNGERESYSIQITSNLEESATATDRCVHTITRPEGKDKLISLSFDWQRTFKSARAPNRELMDDELKKAEKAAMSYFEDLAEGNRFDEQIISSAT